MPVNYGIIKRGGYRKFVVCGYTSTRGEGVRKASVNGATHFSKARDLNICPKENEAGDKKTQKRRDQQNRFLSFLENQTE